MKSPTKNTASTGVIGFLNAIIADSERAIDEAEKSEKQDVEDFEEGQKRLRNSNEKLKKAPILPQILQRLSVDSPLGILHDARRKYPWIFALVSRLKKVSTSGCKTS